MTAQELKQAIEAARPGDQIVYHYGNLAADVCEEPDLVEVRKMAKRYSDYGMVMLVQRRRGSGGWFEYIAIRTRQR